MFTSWEELRSHLPVKEIGIVLAGVRTATPRVDGPSSGQARLEGGGGVNMISSF